MLSELDNSTLLITGGTGSFGKAVLKRYLSSNIREVRVFSRDEEKQDTLRQEVADDRVKFFIGDVRDRDSVTNAMHGVDYVFHAAALKQVPSCEFFPLEALNTNVIGASNVIEAADSVNVKKVIVLSTDKAVYPVNAMGMSKALMEKLAIAKARSTNRSDFICSATRYGNVMGSRGSVIPLFIKQLQSGQKLTITDPNMTRFMMSLDDAVDLVELAFVSAKPGDIMVQKAPAATILVVAAALCELFGVDSHDHRIIGVRHGEKSYETLVSKEEMLKAEEFDHYYRIPADLRALNYDKYISEGSAELSGLSEYTSSAGDQLLNVQQVKELLLQQSFVRAALG